MANQNPHGPDGRFTPNQDGVVNTDHVRFKAPPELRQRLEQAAQLYGGNLSARCRLACTIADCMGTLCYLRSPLALREFTQAERAAAVLRVEVDLEYWTEVAFPVERLVADMN